MKIPSWMAIGREKKQTLINTSLTFLKWWSSFVLKTFTDPAETISSPNLFHSSQTLLANLNFPMSKRYLFLNSLKLCPLLAPSPITWKNPSGSKFSKPLKILKTSIRSARRNLLKSSEPQDPQPVLVIITGPRNYTPSTILVALVIEIPGHFISNSLYGWMLHGGTCSCIGEFSILLCMLSLWKTKFSSILWEFKWKCTERIFRSEIEEIEASCKCCLSFIFCNRMFTNL